MNIFRVGFSSLYNQTQIGLKRAENNNQVSFTGSQTLDRDECTFAGTSPRFMRRIKKNLEDMKGAKKLPWINPQNISDRVCSGNDNSLRTAEEQITYFNDEELKLFLELTDKTLKVNPKKVEFLVAYGGLGERIINLITYAGEKNPEAKETLAYIKQAATDNHKYDGQIDKQDCLDHLDKAIQCLNELHS